jgi:hypothetical protein
MNRAEVSLGAAQIAELNADLVRRRYVPVGTEAWTVRVNVRQLRIPR